MNDRTRSRNVRAAILALLFLLVPCCVFAQNGPQTIQKTGWDFAVWVAAETGEENTNSFAESQIWSAGIFAGRALTAAIGNSWRSGNLEYAADFAPVFETYGNQRTHGIEFEPAILRWNSALYTRRISPYIELAGGAVITPTNLPPGNTSSFNFTAKGGGGIYLWTLNRQGTRKPQSLDLGCRWSHISNANLGVENTEFNGVQFTIAYHWFK
jgi:hypothetical protein